MIHSQDSQFNCLPSDVRLTEFLWATWETQNYVTTLLDGMTIEQKLIELNASCKNGKLVDGNGREIRFVRLVGWGNAPYNYQEILYKQSVTIEKLMETYTVITIAFNTSPYRIP